MNPYLRASIICLFLALVVVVIFLLEGCQSYTVTGVCRHEATYAISVMGEQHPVRVARGYWGRSDHVRAQAYLDGAWRWLCVDYPDVITCAGDTGFAPTQFYKPQIWLSMFGWDLKGNK